jgi:U3 small nucleolar RNA-associated protein 13
MRIYKLNPNLENERQLEPELLRTLKPHSAPVVVSATDHSGALLATGGADGIVKVWDIRGGYVTHTFHGHSGLVSALKFFELDPSAVEKEPTKGKKRKKSAALDPEPSDESLGYRLASGGEDGKVRIWDLHKRSSVILDSHASVVRKLDFCREKNIFVSASRDRTIVVWDSRTWKARITIPVLEELETAGFLGGGSFIYSGGESARLRIWSPTTGAELSKAQSPGTEAEAIQDSVYFPNLPFILTVHADQTLNFHGTEGLSSDVIEPLPILRTLCGTHGQIVDVAYVGLDKSLLALATNSEDIRIISLNKTQSSGSTVSGGYFGSDVATLKGHDDIVICMDSDWSGHWIVTGAKDNTARLWRLDPASNSFACYATLTGHAGSLGAVALPHTPPPPDSPARAHPLDHPPEYLLTGAQDKTIKRWDLPRPGTGGGRARESPRATYTRKAHDKDINALAVHPTAPLFASASQDRTVKVWAAADGTTVGLLRGHKRGVWTVAFSPPGTSLRGGSLPGGGPAGGAGPRGYVLTGSADRSVRLWSLADYTCLATLEGHTNSVLKVVWLPPAAPPPRAPPAEDDDGDAPMAGAGWDAPPDPRGPLAASAAADGLVKVWAVQHGECAATLDNHAERVWALAAPWPLPPPAAPTNGHAPPPPPDARTAALVSGDAAGALTFWRDTTAASAAAARAARERLVEREQALAGMARAGDVRGAVALALALDRPGRLLALLRDVAASEADRPDDDDDGEDGGAEGGEGRRKKGAFSGSAAVDEVIAGLADEQLLRLLACVRAWNSGARDAVVAQRVLRAVVAAHGVERLASLGRRAAHHQQQDRDEEGGGGGRKEGVKGLPGVGELVEGLRAHSERHFERVSALWDESFLVDYLLREMDDVVG